jgi:hypothetical protein
MRGVKSLAVSTLAWMVRGDWWFLAGGRVGRVSGIIAHLEEACQELLAELLNGWARATNEKHALMCRGHNDFLHASTPAHLSHLRHFHARPNNSLAKQNKREQWRIIGATVPGSCAKASAHWQRLSCAATMQQWHASMHATHIAFPLSTYTVFLFQLGRHPLTTATSEAQEKRSGLRGVVAVVGLAVPTKEKNDLPVGYLSSRNHAQQAAILLGARTSNTRPSKFTEKLFNPLLMRLRKDKGETPMLQVVNVGIDTIIVNVKYLDDHGKPAKEQAFPGWLEERLQEWQEVAKEEGKPHVTAMTFNDARLLMLPNGASVWKYIVKNDCVQVQMVPRLDIPALARVTFSSPYLWSCASPQDAVDAVHAFCLDLFRRDVMLQAAQVDMCVDTVGLRIPADWQKVFVSRGQARRPIVPSQKDYPVYRGLKLETLTFSGHGQPVSCKIYDKIAEIKQHSPDKVWFYPIWTRGGWNSTDPVWRVEFSEGRECLHEQDIEDIYDALRNIKRMWAYCSQEWLRMVTPAKTPNRTRWATSPGWKQIQRAFDTYGDKMLDALGPLVREAKRKVNIDRGVAALAGYATTLAAWLPIDENEIDPDELMEIIKDFVQERWCQRGTSLPDVIREKKFLYSQKG